jgi:FKBP-type peptidyl-prolyl cis-trans isomerase
MRKLPNIAVTTTLAITIIFAGAAAAQQTPSTNPSTTPPPASAGTAKTQTGTAPKSSTGATAQHHAAPPPLVLKTDKDKESYAIGMNIANSFRRDGVEVDPNIVSQGLKDALAGRKTALTDDEAKALIASLQVRLNKQRAETAQIAAAAAAEAAKKVGDANKAAGDAFLAENKTKDGVVTLPSGLQYKILTEGTGPKPAATDTVVCNYKGTLLDNTEFDNSYKRNQPLTIPVSGVIKGWTEALQLMPVGSRWQLFIPPDLAYGAVQRDPIGPNSTLIFEVELLSIQEKKEPAK